MRLVKILAASFAVCASSCDDINNAGASRNIQQPAEITYDNAVICAAASSIIKNLDGNIGGTPAEEMVVLLAREEYINARMDAFNKRGNKTLSDVEVDIYSDVLALHGNERSAENFSTIYNLVTDSCRKIYASQSTNQRYQSIFPS